MHHYQLYGLVLCRVIHRCQADNVSDAGTTSATGGGSPRIFKVFLLFFASTVGAARQPCQPRAVGYVDKWLGLHLLSSSDRRPGR